MSGKRKVLVVDDEDALTRLERRWLEPAGYEVQDAKNGRRALETLGQWTPDLVVTDYTMPEMDGYAFACKARDELGYRGMIVLVSARMVDFQRERPGAGQYINLFLEKPFGQDSFLRIVRQALPESQ